MSRRILREQLFKLLFRVEFNDLEEMPQQCGFFFDDIDNDISEQYMEVVSMPYARILPIEKEDTSKAFENEKAAPYHVNNPLFPYD